MGLPNTFPQTVYDVFQNFGQDLALSAQNDLLTCTGEIRSQQRVLRRLLTMPGSYIWNPTYGAGLPSFIGRYLSSDRFDEIRSLITSQIFLEDSVAQNPAPVILLQTIQGGLFVQITYTISQSQQQTVLTFEV